MAAYCHTRQPKSVLKPIFKYGNLLDPARDRNGYDSQIATNNLECLETTRTLQQNTIHRLEAQIRGLQVSVETMGHFISDLVDIRKDIDIPGDVRRIVAQLVTAERRRSRTEEHSNIKVSGKDIIGENKRNLSFTLKNAQSSPNLGMTLLGTSAIQFGRHIEMNPRKAESSTANLMSSQNSAMLVKKDQNNSKISFKADNMRQASEEISSRDSLLQHKGSQFPANEKFNFKSDSSAHELLSISQKISEEVSSVTHVHPLDSCSGVSFTYGGTTKLKTLKPVRAMSAHSFNLKSQLPDDKLNPEIK